MTVTVTVRDRARATARVRARCNASSPLSASATVTDTSLGGRVEPKEPPSVTALLEPALVPATLVTLWTTAGSEAHV